jgi:hypothetical protein
MKKVINKKDISWRKLVKDKNFFHHLEKDEKHLTKVPAFE